HWHSASVRDFTSEPHSGIIGRNEGEILNLVDRRARTAQDALLEISRTPPEKTLATVQKLTMPSHHDVRVEDVDLRRLGAILATSYDRQLRDFASLLLVENLGPRTLQTLALIAEVVHGAPSRFRDPARFSFAVGGKDRHPFPVPLKTYDESLAFLRKALDSAKLGRTEKLDGFKRLDSLVRKVEERHEPTADFEGIIRHEHAISRELGGRSVFDDQRESKVRRDSRQLSLF
ncbi:MAG TPA: DUF763 domain-containing protein, partial [Bryobacteraceae bacterium]